MQEREPERVRARARARERERDRDRDRECVREKANEQVSVCERERDSSSAAVDASQLAQHATRHNTHTHIRCVCVWCRKSAHALQSERHWRWPS